MAPPPRVLIIGAVHHDPAGRARLVAAFERSGVAPSRTLVSVEVSPLSLSFRRRHAPLLIDRLSRSLAEVAAERGLTVDELWAHGGIAALARYLWPPAEFTAARAWAGPGRVRLAEPAVTSQRELAHAWELVSTANVRAVLDGDDPSPTARAEAAYRRARRAIERGEAIEADAEREDHLAGFIRRLTERHPRVIHVGGWAHVPGLLKRLADLEPAWDLAE